MLHIQRDGNALKFHLHNPPQRNAITLSMVQRFSNASFADVIVAVLMHTEGPAFCSGGDVRTLVEGIMQQDGPGMWKALDFFAQGKKREHMGRGTL